MTWAVVLCKFQNVPQEYAPPDFFRRYFTSFGRGTGGSFDYWQDISNGKFVDHSEVFGWFQIPHDSTEIDPPPGQQYGLDRNTYFQWAVDAAHSNGVPLQNFPRAIFIFNHNGDHGALIAARNSTVFSLLPGAPIEPTFISHETGHTLGLQHSFSNNVAGTALVEYGDYWDIMSAMDVGKFQNAFGPAGPGLCAPYLDQMQWLDRARVFQAPRFGNTSDDVVLEALNTTKPQGWIAANIGGFKGALSFLIELRVQTKWDKGLPRAAILIHRVENGRAVLVTTGRLGHPRNDWQAGDTFFNAELGPFAVSVLDIDAANQRATVRILRDSTSFWTGAMAVNANGGMHVAMASLGNQLWHNAQSAPTVGAAWSGWRALSHPGNKAKALALAAHTDGRMHAVMAGLDDQLWHNEQLGGGGGAAWTDWNMLSHAGNKAKTLALAAHADGRMHAVMAGMDNQIWHNEQLGNGVSAAWSDWRVLSYSGNKAKTLALAAHPDGRMHAVMAGMDNQIWHNEQLGSGAGAAWTDWNMLSFAGNKAKLLALAAHADGRMHAVMAGMDNQVWHNEQLGSGVSAAWSDWHVLSFVGNKAKILALAAHPDGRMHAVMAGMDNQIWHNEQQAAGPGAAWSDWHMLSLPGEKAVGLTLAAHPDGRMHAVMAGLDRQMWANEQVRAGVNAAWSGWRRIE